MGLRDAIQGRRRFSPALVGGAGVVVAILLIGGVSVLAQSTESESERNARIAGNERYAAPAIPGFDAPPDTVVVPPGDDPAVAGQDLVAPAESAGDLIHEGVEPESLEELYSDTPIPPNMFETMYPRSESRLDAVTFTRAKDLAAAVVRARVAGPGREQFPGFFAADVWPTPIVDTYVSDFATASSVPGYPALIRAVVIWHGESNDGNKFLQVRVAQYVTKDGDVFKPVRADDLPEQIQRQDGLLSGVSVIG